MPKQTLNGFPVERRKLSELTKAPWNPRRISDQQADALKRSLSEFGTVEPIIVNKTTGHIVGGHQRLDALVANGEIETDVLIVEMPEERERALNIALNRISGEWDEDKLGELLNELKESRDICLTGFSQEDIADMLGQTISGGKTDPDEIPEHVETICKAGDIWQLGEHRLMCGDSANAKDVALVMSKGKAFMCVSSPPYWIGKEYENEKTIDQIKNFIASICENVSSVMLDNGRICINTGIMSNAKIVGVLDVRLILDWWQECFRNIGWFTRNVRIWVKSGGLPGVGPHNDQCDMHWEFLATFWKKTNEYRGQNKISKPWAMLGFWDDIGGEKQTIHTAPYPIEIPSRFIELYSKTGEIIYDPFVGSGTTIIACEQLGRRCFAMEIDPHYCDVSIARWEKFTGKKAVKLGIPTRHNTSH